MSNDSRHRVIARGSLVTLLSLSLFPPVSAAPVLMSLIPGQQAAGQPIFDCSGMQSTSARLKAGLPVQDEWIRRTENQLRAAREGVVQSKEALQMLALKNARDLVVNQLQMLRDMRDMAKGASRQLSQAKFYKMLDAVQKGAEGIEKSISAGKAGADLGSAINNNQATLQEFLKQIGESGIADDLGLKAAELAGPVGVLTVQTFAAARDTFFALYEGHMNAKEMETAARNLADMRAARQAVESRAYELDGLVAAGCAPRPPAPGDRMMVQPEPSPAPSPGTTPAAPAPATPAAPQNQQTAKGGGGSGTGILLGLAVAGGAGYYAYTKYKTCTPPKTNVLTVCSQGGGTSACAAAKAEQTEFCKCSGYSGFSTATGSCTK